MNGPALAAGQEGLFHTLIKTLGPFGFLELALTAVFLLLAFRAPHLGSRSFERIERYFGGLARRRTGQIMAVGLLAVIARAVMLPWLGAPEPSVFDETSIVLQAQTFMHGRLANPTHPFWQHFEAFYVNQVPAYASMYFPGRGAPLAAGLLIANNAWIGVWMSMVLMCMAATWMLQGWVALPMALLGGVLVTVRLGIFSYWVNTYYGGAFTALGAMLVVGALPRIFAEPRWRHGLVMGLGVFILMTTRPYEGALLCIPVAVAVLARFIKFRWKPGRLAFARVALPVLLMVLAGSALLLEYNVATTGNPLKTAYDLNRETYASAPAFLFSPPIKSQNRGPAYFRDYFGTEASKYHYRESFKQLARSVLAKIFHTWNFYVGATLSIAFFAGLWHARREYFLCGASAFFMAGYFLETWNFPQYTAPLFPLLLIFTMRGFEWLRTCDGPQKPARLFLARAMPVAAVALLALPIVSLVFGSPSLGGNSIQTICCSTEYDQLRPALRRQLLASPGRDLVLVKDGPQNPTGYDLVHNEADIDKSEVVWAHRLSPEQDGRLQQYFADRRVWEFEWLAPDGADSTEGQASKQPYRFRPLTGCPATAGNAGCGVAEQPDQAK